MTDWLGSILILGGAFFVFVAALGIVRFPDLYTRMHASSKSTIFGVGLMAIGLCIAFPTTIVIGKTVAIILFLFLTLPLSAHLIARVAYLHKTPMCKETIRDDLKGKYSEDHQNLSS